MLQLHISLRYGIVMSNLPTASSPNLRDLKEQYVELIAKGYVEDRALMELGISKGMYMRLLLDDNEFAIDVEEARKHRAEAWIGEIARDVNTIYDKEDIPGQRLKFDKLMYLAKADNPDRYGSNKKSTDININLSQFKLLPPEEAMRSLALDPFAIPAESILVEEDEEDLL